MTQTEKQQALEEWRERPERLQAALAMFHPMFVEAVLQNAAANGDQWKRELCVDVWRWADLFLDSRHCV